jgi:hypothetical protein
MATRLQPIPPEPAALPDLTPGSVPEDFPAGAELTPGSVGDAQTRDLELTPGSVPVMLPWEDRPTVRPLAPQRFALQCTIDQETHDALRYAQELLSHSVPSGDVAQVLALALKALIPKLEKARFSATSRPRPRPRPGRRSGNPRSIPAEVQRAVWERDEHQCTFVSEDGHRCEERSTTFRKSRAAARQP